MVDNGLLFYLEFTNLNSSKEMTFSCENLKKDAFWFILSNFDFDNLNT